jgi:hypothetical protein
MSKKLKDSASTIGENGKLSNDRLHEQMTENVTDADFRAQTRARLPVERLRKAHASDRLPWSPARSVLRL